MEYDRELGKRGLGPKLSQGYITKRWGKLNYHDKPEKYCHGFIIFPEIYTQLQIMLAVLFS